MFCLSVTKLENLTNRVTLCSQVLCQTAGGRHRYLRKYSVFPSHEKRWKMNCDLDDPPISVRTSANIDSVRAFTCQNRPLTIGIFADEVNIVACILVTRHVINGLWIWQLDLFGLSPCRAAIISSVVFSLSQYICLLQSFLALYSFCTGPH
jgi:hypothetical protein